MNPALPNDVWYYVYLLHGMAKNGVYIGCTNSLKKRLKEHSEGKTVTTKKMLPVELICFEAYKSKQLAFEREKCLKQYGSALAKLKSRIGVYKKGRAG